MFTENENEFEGWLWQCSLNKIKLLMLPCIVRQSSRKARSVSFSAHFTRCRLFSGKGTWSWSRCLLLAEETFQNDWQVGRHYLGTAGKFPSPEGRSVSQHEVREQSVEPIIIGKCDWIWLQLSDFFSLVLFLPPFPVFHSSLNYLFPPFLQLYLSTTGAQWSINQLHI